jgi:hypothetical protein
MSLLFNEPATEVYISLEWHYLNHRYLISFFLRCLWFTIKHLWLKNSQQILNSDCIYCFSKSLFTHPISKCVFTLRFSNLFSWLGLYECMWVQNWGPVCVEWPRHSKGPTTFSITTLSMTTLSITTLSITTLSIMTLSIMTLSIKTLSITICSIIGLTCSFVSLTIIEQHILDTTADKQLSWAATDV